MRKAAVCVALLFLAAVLPSLTFTEDQETVWLARAVYAVARDESYETKLAVACAALNRVESPWHPNTLKGVLAEKHQFPAGNYYDQDSLRAAHEALAGNRTLPANVMYFQSTGAPNPLGGRILLQDHRRPGVLYARRQSLSIPWPRAGEFFCIPPLGA